MVVNRLIEALGKDKVSTSETERFRHSKDESPYERVEPDVICFPESTTDVQTIVTIAREENIPITAFGIGSGLEGQAIPIKRGISVNFERMNRIIDYSPEDMIVTVQPGITRMQLNEKINRDGLQFPIDPGADATIGGMIATNASGTTAVKYGVMREQVLDLEVVLSDGTIIHTGSKARKSSSGYHLTGLFTGSEGTLGLITEITLRLHGIPEHSIVARCTFPTIEECAEAAYTVLASDIPVMRMELVDDVSVERVNAYGDYDFPVAHSLFFEFAGAKETAEAEAKLTEQLMQQLGCDHWELAQSTKEKNELWRARHEIAYAFSHVHGKSFFTTDVCVPISKLPDLVTLARSLFDELDLDGGIVGHVGDGNFHTISLFDVTNEDERHRALKLNDRLVAHALSVGGTCTGEHGVGLGKKKYQEKEHVEALTLMKHIKKILDPQNIFNPGKIFD